MNRLQKVSFCERNDLVDPSLNHFFTEKPATSDAKLQCTHITHVVKCETDPTSISHVTNISSHNMTESEAGQEQKNQGKESCSREGGIQLVGATINNLNKILSAW